MITADNAAFALSFEPETGLATFAFAMPGGVNKVDSTSAAGLAAALDWAAAQPGLSGILLTSAHKNFCVGADIDGLVPLVDPDDAWRFVADLNAVFRRLETCGVPVACALVGTALGGGYELALACHHRVALDSPKVQIGLPEVGLGVIPGAGGTQRLPRLVGLQRALEHITLGQPVRAAKAHALGFVEALAPTREAVLAHARQWLLDHPRHTRQPWDQKGFTFPGPAPHSEEARQLFMVAGAKITEKTAGTMPQVEAAVSALQEGAALVFDRALEVEHRYFVRCAVSPQSKAMIRTFWYFRNAAQKAEGLPLAAAHGFRRVGILGAGMMGAGLAALIAARGLTVVVKDVAAPALDAARDQLAAALAQKKDLGAAEREALLARVTFTLDDAPLDGCDLVIEAVVEDDAVKHAVIRAVEPRLAADGVFGSNTSALPITHLASAAAARDRFIGMHFFSPVEKMPLCELIRGADTSDATVARAVRFVLDLGKLPVVVNDGYGFFTTRVFAAYLMEAVTLVAEGHDPVLVEWAARQAGMVVPPLKVYDEVTLRLGLKAILQRARYTGEPLDALPAVRLLRALVEDHGRLGKVSGHGFYDYDAAERHLWPGLRALTGGAIPAETGVDVLAERLMLAQCVEAVRCLDEGIVRERRDAEVAAVFGIGFAPGSGGPLGWLDQRGLPWAVAKLDTLAAAHGERFAAPASLRAMAARGERFFPH